MYECQLIEAKHGGLVMTKKEMELKIEELQNLIIEKDKEIEKLNRKIGKLEAELEAAKKGNAPKEGSAICADVG